MKDILMGIPQFVEKNVYAEFFVNGEGVGKELYLTIDNDKPVELRYIIKKNIDHFDPTKQLMI